MDEEKRLENFLTDIRALNRLLFIIKTRGIAESGLKQIHVMCLFYLIEKGPLSSSELVKYTLEDKAAISKAVKLLKEKAMIEYESGYCQKIHLTEKGKIASEEIIKEAMNVFKIATKDFDEEDSKIFATVLSKIHTNLLNYVKTNHLEE